MTLQRVIAGICDGPFPIYPGLVDRLTEAHLTASSERDGTVAHVLGTCASYAYADAETVTTVMSRMGLPRHSCGYIEQVVDSMFIFSSAYVLQSQCGRLAILCFRGTQPAVLGNWLGDFDVGPDSAVLVPRDGGDRLRVHGGFHRNLRAVWWPVLGELKAALAGQSLANPQLRVEHPLEALYVTGHSLGGAMALLFLLKLSGDPELRPILERLRAVYTFGQPMVLLLPHPPLVDQLTARVFRHLLLHDPVPATPPATWGAFAHVGQEYRYEDAEWQRSSTPVEQLQNLRRLPRYTFSFFQSEGRRENLRYTTSMHGAQHYVAALRPPGRVTELGDWTES